MKNKVVASRRVHHVQVLVRRGKIDPKETLYFAYERLVQTFSMFKLLSM